MITCNRCHEEKDDSEFSTPQWAELSRHGITCKACQYRDYVYSMKRRAEEREAKEAERAAAKAAKEAERAARAVPPGMKRCSTCEEVKPRSEFYKMGAHVRADCKECTRAYRNSDLGRMWRRVDEERHKAQRSPAPRSYRRKHLIQEESLRLAAREGLESGDRMWGYVFEEFAALGYSAEEVLL